MNVRSGNKGDGERRSESIQRKIHCQNISQKPFIFHTTSKPSPQLSDKSEFPSLNETSIKVSSSSQCTGGVLKYSDKLKSHSNAQNQNGASNFFLLKNDPVVTDVSEEPSHNTSNSKWANKWLCKGNKNNLNEKGSFQTMQNELEKPGLVNKKVINLNSSQNIPKAQSNHSLKESYSSRCNSNKNESPKQKYLVNTSDSKLFTAHKTSAVNSNSTSLLSKSNNQIQSGSEIKVIRAKSPVKEEVNDASGNTTIKKKKKRKSKIKRQVALQTGKITVLTPEVHSKILNQTSALTSQNFKGIFTDINDEDEYPELGKSVVPASQKENYPKIESNSDVPRQEATDKSTNTSAEKLLLITKDVTKESFPVSMAKSEDKSIAEKKGKSENKAIHPNDPITVSFYDILVNKNCKTKVKDFKIEVDTPPSTGLPKIKFKKNSCHPHNLLDSSSPAIKRGKERENPKPKKPSQLKKIILLDRKVRREHLLQLKGSIAEEEYVVIGDEADQEVNALKGNETETIDTSITSENSYEHNSSNMLTFPLEVGEQNTVQLSYNGKDLTLYDDLITEMKLADVSETNDEKSNYEDTKHISRIGSSLDKVYTNEINKLNQSEVTESSLASEKHLSTSECPELVLNSLINSVKNVDTSDKEKAVKVLLHTRNFREYCNHLISKDIDDVVYALLDDLARFQDRLHQKDPVKARMKRRMIYGVKEVKKHIKLKKLKCIIVAADIENIETHGGLNDLLNDIKSSAADHHIPCVFALNRKDLGKVCRKPVPVSCVGVFNFEGSEANFKKMAELQAQSKTDYTEICSKLSQSLTHEQVTNLLTAKKEAPETLRAIRTNILGDFFLQPRPKVVKHEETVIKSEKVSDLSDTE